jgi:hypothetical protein
VIIWNNGAFGSGKTQTAFQLHRRTSNSYVYDPENAGLFIQKNIPKSIHKDDFQDYIMWREFTYAMLKYLDQEYDGLIIVPMTIVNPRYFNEIVGKLREDGIIIDHYALCATRVTLLKRLRTRGDGNKSWSARQIDRCIEGLSNFIFTHHIFTDKMTIEDNVQYIASLSNIKLLPDSRGKIRRAYDRVKTQIKHIRF